MGNIRFEFVKVQELLYGESDSNTICPGERNQTVKSINTAIATVNSNGLDTFYVKPCEKGGENEKYSYDYFVDFCNKYDCLFAETE